MGSDKTVARLAGRTLVDRAVAVLEEVFETVVVSVSATPSGRVEATVTDRWRDSGPLGGLEAVLDHAAGRPVFVLACDLPLVGESVVRKIVDDAGAGVAVERATAWIASGLGRDQPLCGLYSAACLEVVRVRLADGMLSMRDLLQQFEVHRVDVGDPGADLLLNVNWPEDLERARELLNGR